MDRSWIIWLLVLSTTLQQILGQGSVFPAREFRGVWVATVANIDWPTSKYHTTAQQKQELDAIIEEVRQRHFNAIVFQIRSTGDAMYNSSLEPWSYYLTGHQGQAPSPYYDPLEYMIQKAHEVGIEVHAWFNPYRARSGSTSRTGLASNNMANRFPSHAYAYGNNLVMDPGAKEVQDFIVDVFSDVARRYDVDGMHMDDYFYPYPVSGQTFPDSSTYHRYQASSGTLSLADWRRENVNTLIQRLGIAIHSIKPYLKFGISPFGIWKAGHPSGIHGLSSYDSLFADSQLWLRQGWVDYLAPQLYWAIDPPAQSYPALLQWWVQQNDQHRHIYAGNSLSKIESKHWGSQEIINQVKISRNLRANESLGNIQFSMRYLQSNTQGISDAFQSIYISRTLTPAMPWLSVPTPQTPSITVTGNTLTWAKDSSGHTWRVLVYTQTADAFELHDLLHNGHTSTHVTDGEYAVTAIARNGVESQVMYIQVVGGVNSNLVG
ncbi:glycosyl hydrolase YngK-like [Mya arenaria]|uniref:glycosyl hydrolase YngK-like n=1 Tax=Mya arenaria TaxID=6604 RepID=UPI0022E43B61|nr:glycosyl hydrolase YngK-like [Mya arenaria]